MMSRSVPTSVLNCSKVTEEEVWSTTQLRQTHCTCSDSAVQRSKPRCSPAHASVSAVNLLPLPPAFSHHPLLSKTIPTALQRPPIFLSTQAWGHAGAHGSTQREHTDVTLSLGLVKVDMLRRLVCVKAWHDSHSQNSERQIKLHTQLQSVVLDAEIPFTSLKWVILLAKTQQPSMGDRTRTTRVLVLGLGKSSKCRLNLNVTYCNF